MRTRISSMAVLLKSLKRLSELPMTVDILLETGVGKTVNGLRKHEQVGEFARSLVARWKKLVPVPQEAERHNLEPEERSYDRNISRKRPRESSPKEDEEVEQGYSKVYQPSCSQPYEPEYEAKKAKRYLEPEKSHQTVTYGVSEGRAWGRESPVLSSDQEYSDYGHAVSPEPSESPQELYLGHCRAEEQEREQKSLNRKASKGHGLQDRPEGGHSRNLSDPQDKTSSSRSREHKSSHKEKQRTDPKGEERVPDLTERPHKGSSKEPLREAALTGGGTERLKAWNSSKREKKREGGGSGVKKERPHFDPEEAPDGFVKKQKLQDPERLKPEKVKLSSEVLLGEREKRKPEVDSFGKSKEKKASGSERTPEGKPKASELGKRAAPFSPPKLGEAELEDEYEQPAMSFESYLSYDQPQKKRKKMAAKPAASVPEKDKGHSKQNGSKSSAKGCDSSRKAHKSASERKQPGSSKPKKSFVDVVPTLPDIPLPPIQANYRPLPSLESILPTQPKRKALSSPTEEDEAGFTGRRLNSKMQVYSGSKSAYLPKMMSLHEQCIRVLSNSIDSIYEVGGVPYSVLEPVLERCTPEQLYRIEECNHVLIEDTDQLWHNHCIRDFKKEKPEEFESWREMYLRLHDAREQRLLMLTENIRSAHANKPKGRVAKMAFVNSAAKPPRDVRRRQEKFGTGGAGVPEKIKIKPVFFTPAKSSTIHTEEDQSYDGPSTSSGHSGPSLGSSSLASYDPRKPPVKKIAPMMAKTIKAFKNRFSRR
ncbi:elongin-A isoform X2 [Varanus komodoensis]|uniref:elongin-A isoform X2 n=1 Tax=Varanus komodoensis TaxID=61221 RepID=UPI001CF767AF|nr:elongin-A isoform X2 [Varanus komodoensis]XP_044280656.1 elongin-A isoform X2 [Varanus komodoensis]